MSSMKIDLLYNEDCVAAHNELRQLHGTPDIYFDEELAVSAQNWANELAKKDVLEHSSESQEGVGENVAVKFVSGGTNFSGEEATDDWYSEIDDYNFNKENQLECGHFSQVIWRDTQKAGFGIAKAESGNVYVVGQYMPPGNYWNKWGENVPPPLSETIERPYQMRLGGMNFNTNAKSVGDVLMGKKTKSSTQNGITLVSTFETYKRSDGTTYEVEVETVESKVDMEEMPAKARKARSGRKRRESHSSQSSSKSLSSSSSSDSSKVEQNGSAFYDIKEIRRDMLQAHNSYRQKHLAGNLVESDDLNDMAQEWAEYLGTRRLYLECNYEYKGRPVGQNILIKLYGKESISAFDVAKEWYKSGLDDFTFGEDDPMRKLRKCGAFSQMVWINSEKMGTGRYIDEENGCTWIVTLYSPQGNIRNKFYDNVCSKR